MQALEKRERREEKREREKRERRERETRRALLCFYSRSEHQLVARGGIWVLCTSARRRPDQ
jgi:hypothetical protein